MPHHFTCVLARDSSDCGPAALMTVARHHGLNVSFSRVRDLVGTDLQGSTLFALDSAAKAIGFNSSCGKVKPEKLHVLPLPAIVHLGAGAEALGHFVVLHQVKDTEVVLADPAAGIVALSMADFGKRWTRHAVLLSPIGCPPHARDSFSAVKQLLKVALAERRALLISIVLAFLISLLALTSSVFVKMTLDRVIPRADRHLLYVMGAGLLVILIMHALSTFGRKYLLIAMGNRIELNLSGSFINSVLSFPISYFDKRTPGDILSRFNDNAIVKAAIADAFMSAIVDALFLIFPAVVLAVYNIQLTALALCLVPLLLLAVALVVNPLLRHERLLTGRLTRLASDVIDLAVNIKLIKAYTAERQIADKISKAQHMVEESSARIAILSEILGTGCNGLTAVSSALLLFMGARLSMTHTLTVGQLMFFYSAIGIFLTAANNLPSSIIAIQKALIGIERLEEIGSVPPENSTPEVGIGPRPVRGAIDFDHVSFSHRKAHPILTDITLHIPAGSMTAIVGESGVGKSTLVSLIAGFHTPQDGKIWIDDTNILQIDKAVLRSQISIVFQEAGIISGTVRENLLLGSPTATFEQLQWATRYAKADDFIKDLPLGYEYNVGPHGCALSSGQQQRIGIARALLRNSPIVILDEATGNLDSETEADIIANLTRLRHNKTTLMVTHRLNVARKADTIIVLQRNSPPEVGSHDDLLARGGRYHSMWRACALMS